MKETAFIFLFLSTGTVIFTILGMIWARKEAVCI